MRSSAVVDLAPVASTDHRQVRRLHAAAAALAHLHRLVDGLEQMVAVVAHMHREHAVVAGRDLAQRDQFVRPAYEIGAYIRPVETPMAPSRRALSSSVCIWRSSSRVAGRSAYPITLAWMRGGRPVARR